MIALLSSFQFLVLCQYYSWCVNENTQNTAPSYCLSTALLVMCLKTVFSCGSNCSSILILLHFFVMRCLFYFLVLSFRALCPSLKSVLLFAIIACFCYTLVIGLVLETVRQFILFLACLLSIYV